MNPAPSGNKFITKKESHRMASPISAVDKSKYLSKTNAGSSRTRQETETQVVSLKLMRPQISRMNEIKNDDVE